MSLFNATMIPLLGKALDAYTVRQKVLAANIANITTPGYRSQTVSFEEELAGAIQGSRLAGSAMDASALNKVVPRVQATEERINDVASGYNNVDIDVEMAELARNQIRFRYAARLLANTFRGIQQSIRGTS